MPQPPGPHRLVFFLGGFDPKSPRQYHRLYRRAVQARPAGAGERVSVSARADEGGLLAGWRVVWQPAGAAEPLLTDYRVMRWDDVVRRHWVRRGVQVLRDYWHVYVGGHRERLFPRTWRTARATWGVGMFPLALGLTLAGVTGLLAALVWAVAGWPRSPGAMAAGAAVATGAWLLLWRALEHRLDSEWLLRLLAFSREQARGELPDLEARLDAMADALVAQAAASTAREVLLVGHSTGSIMAASVAARALRQAPWLGGRGPALGLLTLGHCTPLVGYFDSATGFRAELAALRASPALTWWDYSAPADWAAFARVQPWMGEEAAAPAARLHQASPRFHRTMAEEDYARLMKDRRALHMHYLNAPQRPGGYDVVTLTAGPLTLAQRHAALAAAAPAAE